MPRILLPLVALVFVCFFVGSCKNSASEDIMKSETTYQERTRMLKILALGDSYTVGRGLQRTESWPEQLASQLRKDKLKVDTPVIVAATGWTSTDLLRVIDNSNLNKPYDLVTLLIGANDQFQGFSENSYSAGFEKLLINAIDLAGDRSSHVIVISIPDYSVTQFGKLIGPARIKDTIDIFNMINKKFAEINGVYYVNVTELSRRAAEDLTLLASDGLHPSAKMYAEWVKLIKPVAINALGIKLND